MQRQTVLGIGNLLLGDEGVGVHAVRILQDKTLPPGTKVVEVGTAILDALPEIATADKLIIIDAMNGGGTPGTIYRVSLKDCRNNPTIGSMHGFDVLRVLALVGRTEPPEGVVYGVEPAQIDWSLELSEQVKESLAVLTEKVEEEIFR